MKRKVFGTIRVWIGAWLIFCGWISITKNTPTAINICVSILVGVAAIAYTYFVFVPWLEYDHHGIFLRYPFGLAGKKHQWWEVEDIWTNEFPYSTKLTFGNGWTIRLMGSNTRNYFGVLKEIVALVKKKNKDVEIDKSTLKLLKKHPFIYL